MPAAGDTDNTDDADNTDDSSEELLVAGSGPSPLLRWQIVGAIMVLLVLGAIRLSMTHRDKPVATVPTPSATAPVGPRPVDVTLGRPGAMTRNDPSHCPDFVLCTSTKTVPAAMTDAVRAYLLGARPRSEYTVIQSHPRKLYYRHLNVTSGSTEILVLVSQAERADPRDVRPTEQTTADPDETIAYIRRVTSDGYLVEVEVTGGADSRPQLAVARALAADPRMLALN